MVKNSRTRTSGLKLNIFVHEAKEIHNCLSPLYKKSVYCSKISYNSQLNSTQVYFDFIEKKFFYEDVNMDHVLFQTDPYLEIYHPEKMEISIYAY